MHKGCFELLEDQSLYLWWNLVTLSARLEIGAEEDPLCQRLFSRLL